MALHGLAGMGRSGKERWRLTTLRKTWWRRRPCDTPGCLKPIAESHGPVLGLVRVAGCDSGLVPGRRGGMGSSQLPRR